MIELLTIVEEARDVGSMPGQILLALGLIALGITVVYLHKTGEVKLASQHAIHSAELGKMMVLLEEKDNRMTQERLQRITQLMELVRDSTAVQTRLVDAIRDLKDMIHSQAQLIERIPSR